MAKRTSRRRNKQASENLVTQEAVKMGLMGGKYKPLTDHDIEKIENSFAIIEIRGGKESAKRSCIQDKLFAL